MGATANRVNGAPAKTAESGPRVEIMTVTPTLAENWLTRSLDRNRKVRRAKVQQYAADIKAGRWHLSYQAVSFDVEHNLVNGQHRLNAIILADTPVVSPVMWGLPVESVMTIDGGMKRSTDDNFKIAGRDYPKQCGSTVRRLFLGVRQVKRTFTDMEVDEFMADNCEAVAFAHRVLAKGRTATASTRAPVVRAYLKRNPRKRLEQFGAVLTTGLMVPGDEAAVHLRNFILENESSSGRGRTELYGKTETALYAFLCSEPLGRLMAATTELFPLPGEGDWPAE